MDSGASGETGVFGGLPLPALGRRKLGGGGQGEVYLAVTDSPGLANFGITNEVAIPVGDLAVLALKRPVPGDRSAISRLRRESQLMAMAASIYVPAVGTFQDGENPFFAMEYVASRTLRELCSSKLDGERVVFSESELAVFADGLWSAVQHLHGLEIAHRDLSWNNVLVPIRGLKLDEERPDGRRTLPYVLSNPVLVDFGYATHPEVDLFDAEGRAVISIGPGDTEGFVPPEGGGARMSIEMQMARDVYQWGCNVFVAAAGRQPFPSGHRTNVDVDPNELDRYFSNGDLRQAVKMALSGEPTRRNPNEISSFIAHATQGLPAAESMERLRRDRDRLKRELLKAKKDLSISHSASESAARSSDSGEAEQRDSWRLAQVLQEELDSANEQLRRCREDNSVQENLIIDLRERVAGVRELQTSMKRVEQQLKASNDERARLRTRVRELEAALGREEGQ